MYYTYIHRTADTGRVFYVGKGTGQRAKSRTRNIHWRRVVAKHGLMVEIVASWPSESEAFDHEKFLIWCFRSMGADLTNMTDGGEGLSGMKFSQEHRYKIGAGNRGKVRDPLHCARISESKRGKPGTPHTEEFKKRVSENNRTRVLSAETIERMRVAQLGKTISETTKLKISAATKGKKRSDQVRTNMRAANSKARSVKCIDTGVVFPSGSHAAEWLASLGHKGAINQCVNRAARGEASSAYGYRWAVA